MLLGVGTGSGPERPQNTVSSLWHCMGVSQGVEGGRRSQAKVREESSQAEAQNDSRKCLDFSTRREGKQAPPPNPHPASLLAAQSILQRRA